MHARKNLGSRAGRRPKQRLQSHIQSAKEPRFFGLGQRRRPAGICANFAQMPRNLPPRQRAADIVRRPMVPGGRHCPPALLQTPRRQRNIRRHAAISHRHARGNPVIRHIRARTHGDHGHICPPSRPYRPGPVGDDDDRQPKPIGNAKYFLTHRAGVAVNIDRSQALTRPSGAALRPNSPRADLR